jgi:hypothetical protein
VRRSWEAFNRGDWHTVRGGQIVSGREYGTKEQALEAVGHGSGRDESV